MIQRMVERFRDVDLHQTGAWADALGVIERCQPRHRRAVASSILGAVRAEHLGTFLVMTAGQLAFRWQSVSIELTELDFQRAFSQLFGFSIQEVGNRAIQVGGYDELACLVSHSAPVRGMGLDQVLTLLQDIQAWRVEPIDGLVTLFRAVEPTAMRYIVRMLQGIPPLKLEVTFLLDAIAAATQLEQHLIRECYALNGDLAETGARAFKGRRALSQVHSRTGRPFIVSPHARVRSLDSVLKQPGEARDVEPEPVGIRVQIHRRHAAFQIFTSRLQDVSKAFPEIISMLEQHLSDTEDLICEGYLQMPSLSREEALRTLEGRIMRLPLARGAKAEPDPRCSLMVTELIRHGREELLFRPLLERRVRLRSMVGLASPIQLPPSLGQVKLERAQEWLTSLASPPHSLLIHDPTAMVRLGRDSLSQSLALGDLPLCLVVLSATLNAQGVPTRVQLACLHEDQLCHVGEVTVGNTDRSLWQLLIERMRTRIVLRRPDRLILRPELVLEVTSRGLRSSPRRASNLSLDRVSLTVIREDLSVADVHTRLQLEAWLEAHRLVSGGQGSFLVDDPLGSDASEDATVDEPSTHPITSSQRSCEA